MLRKRSKIWKCFTKVLQWHCVYVAHLDTMLQMGFSQEEIEESLIKQKYNEVMATYLLLDYRNSEVHIHKHTCALMPTEAAKLWWYFLFKISYSQLDEGINLLLKPRPGSDLTNSNGPSPPQMVQRSVSSTQKPVRRSTDQGERIGSFVNEDLYKHIHTYVCPLYSLFFVPQVHTRNGLREKTSMEWRILGGKVQIAPPKFHPVQLSPANAKRVLHPLL